MGGGGDGFGPKKFERLVTIHFLSDHSQIWWEFTHGHWLDRPKIYVDRPSSFSSIAIFRRVPKPKKSTFFSKKKFDQSQNLQKSLKLNEKFWRWGLSIHDNRVKFSEGSIKTFRLHSRFSKGYPNRKNWHFFSKKKSLSSHRICKNHWNSMKISGDGA